MPQNLSYIERELANLSRQAKDATTQMNLLEKALANVIRTSTKGGGVASPVSVERVTQQTLSSGLSPAGAPVGNRAIVGSEVTPKVEGILREYGRLEAEVALLQKQTTQLNAASARLAQAQEEASGILFSEQQINARKVAAAERQAAAEQTLESQLNKLRIESEDQLRAWQEDTQATKDLSRKKKEAVTKLGEMSRTIDAEGFARPGGKTAGGGGAEQAAPRYTQADLDKIFSRQAVTNIGQTAGQYQFSPENIKRITEYANSYKQLQYEAQGANGVMRKLVLTVDQAGNVFTSTQKQFRTFFSAIRRNVGEMIKWSTATLLVWGSIRKLGELLQIAIDNESKLASIAVILGEEHTNLTQVFNAAADAASATGESIDGVLDGYVQAYRATGNITNETERAAQAQALLTDALTLSKLSSLSTAQAMDTLTGALRQAGLGFDEGYVLLDKWVAVSRQANVGIETLAESFAITATSASNAGLEWDELNGIIATLAESTTLSATESGNAIRAFISGFTTDTAVKELTKFGIAVTDKTGETRGFLDVMKEISALFEQGIITESELNKISRAIGGGARREAQVATTIKNLGRAQEVAAISAQANGDAQRALAIQLDTVQTALTKLNNSFQKLARTMGAEGGVLEAAGTVLDIFTKMVDATSTLVKNLGDITPILAGMALVFAATSKETRGLFATNLIGGIGQTINRFTGRGDISLEDQRLLAASQGLTAAPGAQVGLGTRVSNRLLGPGYGRNAGSLAGQALAGGFTLYSAGRDIQQGNVEGAAGSVVGGIIGGLLTGGSPVGIVIGTAAGEAFANATFGYKAEFTRFFQDIFDEGGKDIIDPEKTGADLSAATEEVFKQYGGGSTAIGKFFANLGAGVLNLGYGAGQALGTLPATAPNARITAETLALSGRGAFGDISAAAGSVYELQIAQQALRGQTAGEVKPGAFKFAVTDEQEQLLKEYRDFLTDLELTQAEIFRAGAIAGEISDKDLRDALDKIPNLQSILTKYFVTFGEELINASDEVTGVTDAFEYMTNIIVNGSTEQIQYLNATAQEIAGIRNAIEAADAAGTDQVILGFDDPSTTDVDERRIVSRAVAMQEAAEIAQGAVTSLLTQTRELNQARIDIPGIVNLDVNEEDFDVILQYAESIQDRFWEGFWSEGILTDFTEADLEDTLAPFMLKAGQDGGMKYVEGFNQALIQQAASELIEQGIIEENKPADRRGLQSFDIPSSQLPSVMARYQQLVNITGQAGYSPDEETFAALFTDYIAMPITADLTLLNIAMQELIDVNKKELDGIYNLPTDASFYVPFTGYREGFVNQGGGGGAGLLEGLGAGNFPLSEAEIEARKEKFLAEYPRYELPEQLGPPVPEGFFGKPLGPPTPATSKYDYPSEGERFRGLTPEMYGYEAPDTPLISPPIWLKNLFEQGRDAIGAIEPPVLPGADAAGQIITDLGNLLKSLFGLEGEDSTITTKLQIESTTNTIVQLDGQVIANAIKPYLLNDEVRYEGTAGSAVKRFVI